MMAAVFLSQLRQRYAALAPRRIFEIKQAAEAMAREELGHVSTLRKERRRAYHQEHEEAAILR